MKISERKYQSMPTCLQTLFRKLPNPARDEVERCFPVTGPSTTGIRDPNGSMGYHGGASGLPGVISGHNDNGGSASRFFQHCDYTLEEIAELNGIEPKRIVYSGKASKQDRGQDAGVNNNHPTTKPTSLLRYLLRLSVPPGATVIDPFLGSGSTAKAALLEGFNVIGIEREPDYFEIACARTAHVAPEAFDVKAKPTKAVPVQAGLFESAA